MKRTYLIILFFYIITCFSLVAQNQKPGINNDPHPLGKGERPYEMKDRKEEREPILTFVDCSQWTVETKGCEADLYKSNDQLLYRDFVGKLTYKGTAETSEIILRPGKEIVFHDSWDCINFWNYGAHWLWGEPNARRAFRYFALIEDADQKVHEIDFVQSGYAGMVHQYWFMNHIKLPNDIKRPIKFTGINFSGRKVTDEEALNIYLGPLYAFEENLAQLKFEPYPDNLPFPTRKTTILPTNKTSQYSTEIKEGNKQVEFTYIGEDTKLTYQVDLDNDFPLGVYLKNKPKLSLLDGANIQFADGDAKWTVENKSIEKDTLFVKANATLNGEVVEFDFYYTLQQKSLIVGMDELAKKGHVERVDLGGVGKIKDGKLFRIPFLTFDYNRGPRLLYADGLFCFMQFDWYYTDASNFYINLSKIKDGKAIHNGGVKYIPKTNGKRNPLHERLFINVSPDVHEVFPTIDNPKSPMRSAQANRLWRINGDPNHENLKNEAKKLRSLGIENLSIRYHEGIWRDEGESYTFRLEAAPGRGGNAAVKGLVDYVKSQDWRVGLYTNYTDFATVNANWNEDWISHGPSGEWQVSWSRCFAPKPMRAMEIQREYAPKIHAMFGTNHSYCDVHTAVSPMSRVDYDYRVPGAATFRRTFECYGQLLLNETKAYAGPVYSEGNNHWWYAGLVDGNYANANPKLDKQPIFPDFQLLKIHPLEMDAGNVYVKGSEYLAYTLAYGNIGICDGHEVEMMKRYYMLQPLQEHYSMVSVRKIQYEHDGQYFNTSEALVHGYNEKARLRLEYESGFTVYVNFDEEPWSIEADDRMITLPKYGNYARSQDGSVWSLSGSLGGTNTGSSYDIMHSDNMHYLDTKGNNVETNFMSGNGKIAMKREKFGWEIIPAAEFEVFAFDLSILGIDSEYVQIEGIGSDGLPVEQTEFTHSEGKIKLFHQNKNVLKYRICPAL